ncbi:DeoR family transcriptional regulator [bacterium]|nr:DeoR family transcriptional regulator [bacterium]
MVSSLRQDEILQIARNDGRVTVEDLAQRFGVTLQTIRRDLSAMASAGEVTRVHGGAVWRAGPGNPRRDQRCRVQAAAKIAIARACAADIPNNCSIMLNLGSTTEAVARALLNHTNITVITNSLAVANTLAANAGCEVLLAGGALRRSDSGLVGELTARFFGQFKVDHAVVGCAAIDADGEILDHDPAEVAVSHAILAQAHRPVLVADHTKLLRRAPVRLASLADMAALYTDLPLPEPLAEKCSAWSTALRLP